MFLRKHTFVQVARKSFRTKQQFPLQSAQLIFIKKFKK